MRQVNTGIKKKKKTTTTTTVLRSEISSRRNVSKSVAQGKGYLHFLSELTSEMDVRRHTTKLFSRNTLNDKWASSFPKEISGQNLFEEVIIQSKESFEAF